MKKNIFPFFFFCCTLYIKNNNKVCSFSENLWIEKYYVYLYRYLLDCIYIQKQNYNITQNVHFLANKLEKRKKIKFFLGKRKWNKNFLFLISNLLAGI